VTWRPTVIVDQTAEVSTLECNGFTYLVCLLNPMGYSLCVELTPTVTVRVAINSIIESCSTQHIRIESIVTSDTLLSSSLYHAVATRTAIIEMSPGSVLGALTMRMTMIKSAVRIIISNSTNPIINQLERYITIAANMQCNRGRAVLTGTRPAESFLRRSMEYSTDVGLQIGSPCIGTDDDGVRQECIYLYPETGCSGAHVTLHLYDGTTQAKRQIVPTTYDRLLMMILHGNPDSIAPASTRLEGMDAYDVQIRQTVDHAGNPIPNLHMNPSQLRELFSFSMFRS
jgi:hypothetical protein